MQRQTMTTERLLMGLLLGGIGVGCVEVLYPFFSAILWAAILAFTTWPIHVWIRTRLRLGHVGTAIVMVTIVAVVVVLPLALVAPRGANDAKHLNHLLQGALAAGLPQAPPWLAQVPLVGPTVSGLWNGWAADLDAMVAFFRPYFGEVAKFGLSLLLGLANGIVGFILALTIAFFFYAAGDRFASVLTALVGRIAGSRAPRLIEVTGNTVRGVVYGILGTAIAQGVLTAFGLWLAGVPRPMLLGVLAAALAVLPVGAPVVWIPSAVWLIAEGHTWRGLFLFAYGLIAVSGADSLMRPYFIARGARLPFLLTLLGVLGGALKFGLLGVFVGPVLLGVGYTLVLEWAQPDQPSVLAVPPREA